MMIKIHERPKLISKLKIRTQLNKTHDYLMTSNTVEKFLSIYEVDTANFKKSVKLIEGALNISNLGIDFKNLFDISTFHRSLKKFNTNRLNALDLYEVGMTLKDLIRLMHQ